MNRMVGHTRMRPIAAGGVRQQDLLLFRTQGNVIIQYGVSGKQQCCPALATGLHYNYKSSSIRDEMMREMAMLTQGCACTRARPLSLSLISELYCGLTPQSPVSSVLSLCDACYRYAAMPLLVASVYRSLLPTVGTFQATSLWLWTAISAVPLRLGDNASGFDDLTGETDQS